MKLNARGCLPGCDSSRTVRTCVDVDNGVILRNSSLCFCFRALSVVYQTGRQTPLAARCLRALCNSLSVSMFGLGKVL